MDRETMRQIAALDQAWSEAEDYRDVFLRLAGLRELDLLVALAHQPEALVLVRKACALIGLECERRIEDRGDYGERRQ